MRIAKGQLGSLARLYGIYFFIAQVKWPDLNPIANSFCVCTNKFFF